MKKRILISLLILLLLLVSACSKNMVRIDLDINSDIQRNENGICTISSSVTNPSKLYVFDIKVTTHLIEPETKDVILHKIENISVLKPEETITFTYTEEIKTSCEGQVTAIYEYTQPSP